MIRKLPNILIAAGMLVLLLAYFPVMRDEIWYKFMRAKGQKFVLSENTAQKQSPFAALISTRPISIAPVNRDFSVVIEKIGVNVPVIADVPVTDEAAYAQALKNGVAHASTSQYPSKLPGNVYLFAHASLNFWQLGKYSSVFNLLRKLDLGDRIHVFYKGDEFVYEVVNKEVMSGWNTYPLTRAVIEPTLTLQTCDPPGTTLNRLVVTAKLI
ncbi:MAG: sortase family protein [candidate division WWE3 bacterium GW2011_GWA1_46_21]|uniref:Sortase family protein n=4 Tax=Katanobacteria TaxID=422282 RepID=A0A0G1PCX2_UNCKA|nr:MAG: sortase family protein [candidate division WWE3 bacterium GW2011_GWA1_46_21]KKU50979.1 MAG: sortase family protein [candidate division WWE3 bacterium GW2011_GWC1_47_10]KKU57172.1 MAG: sortase family protein [candidate division WWE3 bacterium GW2011_GWB1_47_11]